MSNAEEKTTKGSTKSEMVRYRCDLPLLTTFDAHADLANKSRSQVLRELMAGWVSRQEQQEARAA